MFCGDSLPWYVKMGCALCLRTGCETMLLKGPVWGGWLGNLACIIIKLLWFKLSKKKRCKPKYISFPGLIKESKLRLSFPIFHAIQSFRIFERRPFCELRHDDINVKRWLFAVSLDVVLVIISLSDEFPHPQFLSRVLFVQPNSQTVEICPWHNISLVSLGKPDIIRDQNYQQRTATKFEIFVVADDLQ